MITVKNLEKYFNHGKKNELHVLNGINVEFPQNGLVCILGESGSGKTTLLNTIGGLDSFASGSMEIDRHIFQKYQPGKIEKVRNSTFGYIFQNYYLLQDYTVLYNVKLALSTYNISEEEKEERALYVLEKLDMAKYKKKLVSQLSGGQQQRVSIARALVKSPKIILADEPTGNLDEENTLRTMSILKRISKECLVILVSHEKRIAQFFADRIIEIQDGKIIKDYENKNKDAYQRMDDGNIYLRDLECTALEGDGNVIHLYQEKESQEKIKLNLAWKNGRLYVQNLREYDVLLAGEEAGCEMLDESKPNIEPESMEEYDFFLPELKAYKKANLRGREIWKLALENIRLMGKKQAFMIGILLITAVLLTISLANFTNGYFINKRDIITEDSHYVTIHASPAHGGIDEEDYEKEFAKFCKNYAFQGKYSDIFKSTGGGLSLRYNGFIQLQAIGLDFDDFSYVSLSHLKKADLIYGRMPEKSTEVVIDKWLIDKVFDINSPYSLLFNNTKSFLNQELVSSINDDTFRIVGICDVGEPNLYIDPYKALGLSAGGYRIASLQQLQAQYPGKYDNISLTTDEVLVTESAYMGYQRRKTDRIGIENAEHEYYSRDYKIAGCFPDDFGEDYVLCDKSCEEIRNGVIVRLKSYKIYTENPEETIRDIKKIASQYDKLTISAFSNYSNQLRQYKEAHQDAISSRYLIAVAAVVVSLFMIYFMIRSNVSSRVEELTVYRLLGIAKRSILSSYLLEMFFITSYTALPAVVITTGVIRFIGSIPSLELQLNFPWYAALALLFAFYLMNLFISIIPVWRTLSKPPAVLAVKKF